MIELLIGLTVGLAFFFATIKAYTLGVEHGKQMNKGIAPKIELNPVRPILKAVKQHEEEKKVKALGNDLDEALGYSKESALRAVKREREVT